MSNTDAEGKRSESPPPDEGTAGGETGPAPEGSGMAVPPQRSSERAGGTGIEEAGLGGGAGDLGAGGDAADDFGGLDDGDD